MLPGAHYTLFARSARRWFYFGACYDCRAEVEVGLSVTFWGVRGSAACAGSAWQRYGGNTSCIEVRCDERRLLLDAGTGLQRFGSALALEPRAPLDLDLLLTHTHIDHICGLPFFGPFFDPRSRFRLHAGHLAPSLTLREVLGMFMAPPLFPVAPGIFSAQMELRDFRAGEDLDLGGGLVVRTAPLNHPNRATGYRIDWKGRSVCYITDIEHPPDGPDPRVVDLARGADLVIYDSTYTEAEYPSHVGWGHSTWNAGARLCEAAGADRLIIFHHEPGHDDDFMDRISAAAEAYRPGTIVAREGMSIGL